MLRYFGCLILGSTGLVISNGGQEMQLAKDRKYMERAVAQMQLDPRPHKVGAVLVVGEQVWEAHGSTAWRTHHAESYLLHRNDVKDADLSDATLYTTLEPCTTRSHPHKSCALLCHERKIRRVVIGTIDPNPKIKKSGVNFLHKQGIEVGYFDNDLEKQIIDLMEPWYSEQSNTMSYDEIFSLLLEQRDLALTDYRGTAVGEAIDLRLCPEINKGWLAGEVEINHSTNQAPMSADLEKEYAEYFQEQYANLRFDQDGRKVMLRIQPTATSDAPKLRLELNETLYSRVLFVRDRIASVPERKAIAQKALLDGKSRDIEYPHSLCIHLLVVTRDNKILITRRAPDLAYYPNTWSASIEENMAPDKDFSPGKPKTLYSLCRRALLEELGLGEDTFKPTNCRILSVFLETGILNISLCGIVTLSITAEDMERLLRGMPYIDKEFTAWSFLEYTEDELINEIINGSMQFHPTSRFRLLMALMHRKGLPTAAAPFFTN